MLNKIIVWIVLKVLKNHKIKGQQRTKILNELLKNIGSLPLGSTISFDSRGTIYLNGKNLDPEQSIAFRESCVALKNSYARTILREQLKFLAIRQGIHEAINDEQILFAKAALWYMHQEDELLERIP